MRWMFPPSRTTNSTPSTSPNLDLKVGTAFELIPLTVTLGSSKSVYPANPGMPVTAWIRVVVDSSSLRGSDTRKFDLVSTVALSLIRAPGNWALSVDFNARNDSSLVSVLT